MESGTGNGGASSVGTAPSSASGTGPLSVGSVGSGSQSGVTGSGSQSGTTGTNAGESGTSTKGATADGTAAAQLEAGAQSAGEFDPLSTGPGPALRDQQAAELAVGGVLRPDVDGKALSPARRHALEQERVMQAARDEQR